MCLKVREPSIRTARRSNPHLPTRFKMKPVHLPHPPQPASPHNRSGCGVIYFLDSRLPVWEKVSILRTVSTSYIGCEATTGNINPLIFGGLQSKILHGRQTQRNVERRNHQKIVATMNKDAVIRLVKRADVDQDGCSVVPGR